MTWRSERSPPRGSEADGLAMRAVQLRPTPTNVWHAHDDRGTVQALRNEEQLAAKELAAREAIARSLLSVERTIQQYAVVHRIAVVVPYLLIAIGAAMTLAAGLYIRDRMQNTGRKRRQETIVRVVDDPLSESLDSSKASSR